MKDVYVAGFYFWRDEMLLVRKHTPSWQSGKLNAIGGKVEAGENSVLAMRREFREETGIDVGGWNLFCQETTENYSVYFFRLTADGDGERPVVQPENNVGEFLFWLPVLMSADSSEVIGNLHWLVPLARDWRRYHCVFETGDDIKKRPTW
jgi:8-oxo-dGTP diphosphatase